MPELVAARGIPPGKIYARIAAGETVEAPDGSLVKWEDVSYSDGNARKVVILGDNCDASHIVPLAIGADVSVRIVSSSSSSSLLSSSSLYLRLRCR